MTTRIIKRDEKPGGLRFLGQLAKSSARQSKLRPLQSVAVGPGQGFPYRAVWIEFIAELDQRPIVYLSEVSAIEVIKGLLMNLADISVAADTELQNILQQKIKAANDEAQAIVDCLRREAKEIAHDMANPVTEHQGD